jgi:hypothetical protein
MARFAPASLVWHAGEQPEVSAVAFDCAPRAQQAKGNGTEADAPTAIGDGFEPDVERVECSLLGSEARRGRLNRFCFQIAMRSLVSTVLQHYSQLARPQRGRRLPANHPRTSEPILAF